MKDFTHGLIHVGGAVGGALVIAGWATATDLRSLRIPNALCYGGTIGAFVFHAGAFGLSGMVASGAGALLGAALLLIPFLLGGLGAGDVKLLATIGAWLGPVSVLLVGLVAASGLVLTAVPRLRCERLEKWWRVRRALLDELQIAVSEPAARRHIVPVAPSILAGVLVASGILFVELHCAWRGSATPYVRDTSRRNSLPNDASLPQATVRNGTEPTAPNRSKLSW